MTEPVDPVDPTWNHPDEPADLPTARTPAGSRLVAGTALVAVGIAAGIGLGQVALSRATPSASNGASVNPGNGGFGTGAGPSELPGGFGQGYRGGFGGSGVTGGSTTSDGPTDAAAIARDVDPGLVDITTTDAGAEAAGTGIVLTSNGEVLTNNHVIDGATAISVRDVGNNRTYSATVVGYDRSTDIAVLQLGNASGLTTVKTASSEPGVGATVVGVGNAGGTGGTPSYAGGAITATNQTITASDEYDGTSEQLTGLLATDAAIQSGDSGGPLVNASGEVVGVDAAAAASYDLTPYGGDSSGASRGYAIPIVTALDVARQIEAGQSSSTVHIGPTAQLGVYVSGGQQDGGGVEIVRLQDGGPAAKAGLEPGDVITSVDGTSVTNPNSLENVMAGLTPGQRIAVGFETAPGKSQSVTVTVTAGVPQ